MEKKWKRILALLLSLIICVQFVPHAFAQEAEEEPVWTYVKGEIVESATTGTPISLMSLEPDGTVSLIEGNHERWIERIDIPGWAKDWYWDFADETFWENDERFALENAEWIDYGDGTGAWENIIPIYDGVVQQPFADNAYALYREVSAYLRAAYDASDRDFPEVYWLTGSTWVSYWYNSIGQVEVYLILKDHTEGYDMRCEDYQSGAAVSAAVAERDSAANKILDGAKNLSTDYDKIRYFNEWLTKNNEYNIGVAFVEDYEDYVSDYAWECISALEGNVGFDGPVCEGYARAFKYLCDQSGIPCVLVDGDGGGPHMWNYVKLEGAWYAVDVTWNDPGWSVDEDGYLDGNPESGDESEDYLAVGADTVIYGKKFSESHILENLASIGGTAFTNGPVLNAKKYVNYTIDQLELSGAYGDRVKEMEISGGNVTLDGEEVTGEWTVTDAHADDIPGVGTTTAYELTFTPDDEQLDVATRTVVPSVTAKQLTDRTVNIAVKEDTYRYTGSGITPEVTVTDSAAPITADDYTVIYKNNITVGTATVTITGKGNYTGSVERTFEIEKAEIAPGISGTLSVPYSVRSIADVTLPAGWTWANEEDLEISLEVGEAVTLNVIYVGADKDNYENLETEVTIVRSTCEHTNTVRVGAVAATTTTAGYTGDLYCEDCNEVIEQGTIIPVLTSEVTDNNNSVSSSVEMDSDKVADTVNKIAEAVKESESTGKKTTVTVDMTNKDGKEATVVAKDVLEAVKGKNVDLILQMDGYTWTINGKDITAATLKDVNLKVILNTDYIPKNVINSLANGRKAVPLSLEYDGEFGFTATLTITLGKEYQDKYGNLYYYNNGKLDFESAGKIDANGKVNLTFKHASDYVIIIDKKSASADTSDSGMAGVYLLLMLLASGAGLYGYLSMNRRRTINVMK